MICVSCPTGVNAGSTALILCPVPLRFTRAIRFPLWHTLHVHDKEQPTDLLHRTNPVLRNRFDNRMERSILPFWQFGDDFGVRDAHLLPRCVVLLFGVLRSHQPSAQACTRRA